MIHIGFTGTRWGMSPPQRGAVYAFLVQMKTGTLHHGDCVGADAQAHRIAVELDMAIEIHPSDGEAKRANSATVDPGLRMTVHPAKPPLKRNDDIVAACTVLVAAPRELREVHRSGTWATVRRARKAPCELYIAWPTGDLERQ